MLRQYFSSKIRIGETMSGSESGSGCTVLIKCCHFIAKQCLCKRWDYIDLSSWNSAYGKLFYINATMLMLKCSILKWTADNEVIQLLIMLMLKFETAMLNHWHCNADAIIQLLIMQMLKFITAMLNHWHCNAAAIIQLLVLQMLKFVTAMLNHWHCNADAII